VKSGTQVKVFGEPVYAPMSGTNGLWWNLEGRGWMADTYLD